MLSIGWALALMVLAGGARADRARDCHEADQADAGMAMSMPGWTTRFDGVAFVTADRQDGRRGATEVDSQNWFMAMAMHTLGAGTATLTGMATLEPLTVHRPGYSALFQEGEAYNGLQITDHQHPHDLLMQLSATVREPLGGHTGVTMAVAAVGEPALGPVAFMHRASSVENPSAPLSHHIFDSTHLSSSVLLVGIDRGPIAFEISAFHGREPDQHHYDVRVGALDSWAARVWLRPGPEWTVQASHGFLRDPEALEPGDQRRTNASISWLRERGTAFTAATLAIGQNVRNFSTVRALLGEFTRHAGRTTVYSRVEALDVETEILLFPEVVHRPHPGELVDPIRAVTGGIVRDIGDTGRLSWAVGGDVSMYGVPRLLQSAYGSHPLAFHLFARVRLNGSGPRMWNMTMGSPMAVSSTMAHMGMAGAER